MNFLGFGLIGFSLYILLSLLSWNPSDPAYFYTNNNSEILNLGGPIGAQISDFFLSVFGNGSYLILFIVTLLSLIHI